MNKSVEIDFAGHELGSKLFEDVIMTLWLIGIFASFTGILVQSFFFITIPHSRKFDEVIVHEMTIARLFYTIMEFYIIYYSEFSYYAINIVVDVIYVHSDMAMLCLMFIFTKNLYNKIVVVFPIINYDLAITTAATWIFPLPISILSLYIQRIDNEYYIYFYHIYSHIKFLLCFLNALIFVEIIRVAFRRNAFLKTAIVTFIFVSVTSLQVLITDLVSYYYKYISSRCLLLIFCVINAYQALILTGIFIILVRGKINNTMLQTVSVKLSDFKRSFLLKNHT